MTQPIVTSRTAATQKSSTQEEGRTRCEVWTRVMGYHRPVVNFNVGKKAEHYSRRHFCEGVSANSKFCEKFETV